MKKLSRVLRGLVYILPAVLIFSYYPIISLGFNETMNFELSLPILWLLVFDFVAFIILIKEKKLSKGCKKWWWAMLFPLFASLSVIWSENVTRGILTCGVLWFVVFAIYAILNLREKFYDERGFDYVFLRFFFGSAVFVSVWCIVQCIMDVAGVPREATLLCRGCVYQMFGFPHPNGFAIEPQFMGNLLLAPTIVAGGILVAACPSDTLRAAQAKSSCSAGHIATKILPIFFVLATTLFLTFSRGAIYAFVIAMIFMSVVFLVKKIGFKKIAMTWGVIVLSFLFALNTQGILAQVSPTNDTYFSGVSKVLNHLSLGIIDIRTEVGDGAEVEDEIEAENEAVFDGYVEESTNIRKELTRNAIKVWSRDFRTIMFGVGIGGAGQAMYDMGLTGTPKEIIQNEYASLLAETGLIGVLIMILTLVMILKIIIKNPMNIIFLSLLISYGVSLLFFSGLANAMQIYLLPPVLYRVLRKKFVS